MTAQWHASGCCSVHRIVDSVKSGTATLRCPELEARRSMYALQLTLNPIASILFTAGFLQRAAIVGALGLLSLSGVWCGFASG